MQLIISLISAVLLLVTVSAPVAAQDSTKTIRLGHGYDRQHDGHGYELYKSGDTYALYFYSYDGHGNPEWFLGTGELKNGWIQGSLDRYTFDHSSNEVSYEEVGAFWVDFTDSGALQACGKEVARPGAKQLARFWWKIGDQSDTWCSEFLRFTDDADPKRKYSGAWFDPKHNGTGFNVTRQNEIATIIAYFYDTAGNPRWAIGTKSRKFAGEFKIALSSLKGYCRTCAPAPLEKYNGGHIKIDFDDKTAHVVGRYFREAQQKFERELNIRLLSDGTSTAGMEVDKQAMSIQDVQDRIFQEPEIYGRHVLNRVFEIDLEVDGDLDILLFRIGNDDPVNEENMPITIFRNTPSGFVEEDTDVKAWVRDIAIEDFDNDGLDDIFIANHGVEPKPIPGGFDFLLLQTPDGGFRDATENLVDNSYMFTHATCSGDYNGDGLVDIVADAPSNPRLYKNVGDGVFIDVTRTDFPYDDLKHTHADSNSYPWCTMGDYNNDGYDDLMFGTGPNPDDVDAHGNHVGLSFVKLLSDGGKLLYNYPDSIIDTNPEGRNFLHDIDHGDTTDMKSTDFNKDGCVDFAHLTSAYVEHAGTYEIGVFHGNCKGEFSLAYRKIVDAEQPKLNFRIRDINRDGLTDIIPIFGQPKYHALNGKHDEFDNNLLLQTDTGDFEPGCVFDYLNIMTPVEYLGNEFAQHRFEGLGSCE